MAAGRKPGTECSHARGQRLDDGTLCRQVSPSPIPMGLPASWATEWSSFRKDVDAYTSAAGRWVDRATELVAGHSKSVLLSLIDCVPFKQASPVSTTLLKHYVERSGVPYILDPIPEEWQEWIVETTKGRPGKHRDLSPYNSGLYDLRNSLGHFDVEVQRNPDGTKTYLISDVYQFGAKKKDKAQRGRHGFPLGRLSPWQIDAIKRLLPEDEYKNPGGFKERWEVRTAGKETILFIPQQYLAEQGKPFEVTGTFAR
jgi:hypothetical protein